MGKKGTLQTGTARPAPGERARAGGRIAVGSGPPAATGLPRAPAKGRGAYRAVPPGAPSSSEPLAATAATATPLTARSFLPSFRARRVGDAISSREKTTPTRLAPKRGDCPTGGLQGAPEARAGPFWIRGWA